MKFFIGFVVLSIIGASASAQMALDFGDIGQTRFDELHVARSDSDQELWRDQTPLPLPKDAYWFVHRIVPGQGAHDWALVGCYHGGNSFEGETYLLRLTAEQTRISPGIAGCKGLLLDLRVGEDWIELDRTDRDIRVRLMTAFDSVQYTETAYFLPTAPPAGSGPDVTRWIGTHPYDLFDETNEQARFPQITDIQSLQDIAGRVQVANEVAQHGDRVIGAGCMPHSYGTEMAACGIRISDGAIAGEIRSRDIPDIGFGLANDPAFRSGVAGIFT